MIDQQTNVELDERIIALDRKRAKQPGGPVWLGQCISSEKGEPLPVLANLLMGLRAEMPGVFAFDEMLHMPMLMKPLSGDKLGFEPHSCTDVDVGTVQERFQHLGLKSLSKEVTFQAVEPVIGHMKAEGHLGRCYLKGRDGDAANTILSAVGYNLRLVLAWLR